jgi:hypothetical protein
VFFEMIVLYSCPLNWYVFTDYGRFILENRSGLRVIYMVNSFFLFGGFWIQDGFCLQFVLMEKKMYCCLPGLSIVCDHDNSF